MKKLSLRASAHTGVAIRHLKTGWIDIIKLNGSIELAPILGLSDVIVDIVETGKTLYENDLEPKQDIVNISARLVANKVSYKFKNERINDICSKLQDILKQ